MKTDNLIKIIKTNISILFLYISISTTSAEYHFNRITTDEGLSHNDITAITQDADGFMWFATRSGLNRYDGKRIKSYHLPVGEKSGINSFMSLCIDEKGTLWAGSEELIRYNSRLDSLEIFTMTTPEGYGINERVIAIGSAGKTVYILTNQSGLFAYNTDSNTLNFHSFPDINSVQEECFIPSALWVDERERVWIGGNCGKLLQFDHQSHDFKEVRLKNIVPADEFIQSIKGTDRLLYIGYQYSGVICYDRESGDYSLLPVDTQSSGDMVYIHDVFVDNHRVWVASERGLFIYDEVSKTTSHLRHDYYDPFSLSDNAVYTIYKDKEEGIWVGTYFAGINYLSLKLAKFVEKHYPLSGKNGISGKAVREICEDKNGLIWIGTEDAGLNTYHPRTGEFTPLQLSYYNVHGLAFVGDKLLAGTFLAGIDIININNLRIEQHLQIVRNRLDDKNSIYSLLYDSQKRIWVGTSSGVYHLNLSDGTFKSIEGLENVYAHHLMEDSRGIIWLSSPSDGVFYIDQDNKIHNMRDAFAEQLHIRADRFLSAMEDSKGLIWFCTGNNGIISYNPADYLLKRYSEPEGLPNNVVYKAVEDNTQNLWFGTNKGLVRLDLQTGNVRVFTKREGLPTNQFNYTSAYKDHNGKLYFGTIAGLVIIDPSSVDNSEEFPEAFITNFRLFNEDVAVSESGLLKESMLRTKKIVLSYDQNSLTFDISVLRFASSQVNSCYILLDGVDKDWRLLDGELRVSYANLLPGEYTFRIKTGNSLGYWKEVHTLYLVISPPFWQTLYAYLFYFLCLSGLMIYFFRRTKKKIKEQQQQMMEQLEQQKERENYKSKMIFFTNIAHEIKTPLSLIKAPLEYILSHKTCDEETRENLQTIEKNTDRLLSLSYQLLDFRKAEANGLILSFEHADISSLLQLTVDRFKPSINAKKLTFNFDMPQEAIYADVDVENLTKIISNLFNNALKFGSSLMNVKAFIQDQSLMIMVENDGGLVPESMIEKIFEPFVQLPEHGDGQTGKGLGLALARSLARLHKGSLTLNVSDGLNRFILSVPCKHKTNNNGETGIPPASINAEEQTEEESARHDLHTLLLVEDNMEMLDFLYKRFTQHYHVLTACDGEEALSRLQEEDVDLIISDVMMPVMDGFEMLKIIKSEVEYSHIPVILLTAKTNLQSKIVGLELGADAYVEKPFSIDYLFVQVQNLIKRRDQVKEQFSKEPLSEPKSIALTRADEYFLEKLNYHIHANLVNSQFSVDLLAEKLYMSRSSLLRKIKGLCNLAPNDYIRLCRLKRAAQLIREGELRINEIASVTGFTSSSYFAKCFQQHFGMLPKDFGKEGKP